MDTIEIKGITLQAIIGVKSWEQQLPQKLCLDLAFHTDAQKASQEDNLQDTVDYDALTRFCETYILDNPVKLIETLANNLAKQIIETFQLQWIKLTLHKPNALAQANDVSITIERNANAS